MHRIQCIRYFGCNMALQMSHHTFQELAGSRFCKGNTTA
jgi:hypothetical protein